MFPGKVDHWEQSQSHEELALQGHNRILSVALEAKKCGVNYTQHHYNEPTVQLSYEGSNRV